MESGLGRFVEQHGRTITNPGVEYHHVMYIQGESIQCTCLLTRLT